MKLTPSLPGRAKRPFGTSSGPRVAATLPPRDLPERALAYRGSESKAALG